MEFTSDIFLLPHFVAVNSSTSDPFAIQVGMLGWAEEEKTSAFMLFSTHCDT